ncbi:MAG TPA: hypothetical protein VGG19_06265 [Tepidisphaeraceae bacterium]|jgi:hypothetical protein
MKTRYTIAMMVMACSSMALALPTSISLPLTSATPSETLAATGFDNAYNLDTTDTANENGTTVPAFNVASNGLSIATLGGDIYGQYDTTTANNAKNVFFSGLDPDGAGGTTTVTADITIANLNNNFHGGGIWIGMDENHYVRLGLINNGNNIVAEAIRENMDYWNAAPNDPPATSSDILDEQLVVASSATPQTTPLSAVLEIVRTGTTATAYVSTNGGTTFQPIGAAFPNVDTVASQMTNPSTDSYDTPPEFKVGVYAFGGGNDNPGAPGEAVATFTNFSAASVPEPTALGLALAAMPLLRRRK